MLFMLSGSTTKNKKEKERMQVSNVFKPTSRSGTLSPAAHKTAFGTILTKQERLQTWSSGMTEKPGDKGGRKKEGTGRQAVGILYSSCKG